jgi:hypothetical protein
VLLIVQSQYRYYEISKIFQPSKVPIKIYFLSCAHISFKINVPHTNNSRTQEVALHNLGTAVLYTRFENIINKMRTKIK